MPSETTETRGADGSPARAGHDPTWAWWARLAAAGVFLATMGLAGSAGRAPDGGPAIRLVARVPDPLVALAVASGALPRPMWTQTYVGNYVAPTLGEGIEPGEIRPFAPGDQVRYVNWRASLRLGKLYVTEHHQEKNAEYTLALSVGRRPLDPLSAVATGALLALLLQVVDFARRSRGAAVDGAAITSQVRYWVRVGILGVALGLVAGALAIGLMPALPSAAYSVLAAGGALIAVVAATRLLVADE